MLSVDEARTRILLGLKPTAPETVSLAEAWGRVLAAPIHARLRQPAADLSAMDGYAIRAADAAPGTTLRVIGRAPAGKIFGGIVTPGTCVRLFTGSVIPEGADTVLIQEDADADGDSLRARVGPEPGQHIRKAGQDFDAGETLLAPGRRLGARDIGLAAAANHPWLTVHRLPRIAILATGDEIFLPGDPIAPGGIVSSNAHTLAALARSAGGAPSILPIAGDDATAIGDAADHARDFDMLVTTGGASVGDHDLVQSALTSRGLTLDFWKIAMRPGKPMIHGHYGTLPVLGLPGNPVSAYVCAVLFLLPALARLGGLPDAPPRTEPAILGAPLRANDHRTDHLRSTLSLDPSGQLIATPFPRQDSAMLKALAYADALIVRVPHDPAKNAGDQVHIMRLKIDGL